MEITYQIALNNVLIHQAIHIVLVIWHESMKNRVDAMNIELDFAMVWTIQLETLIDGNYNRWKLSINLSEVNHECNYINGCIKLWTLQCTLNITIECVQINCSIVYNQSQWNSNE